MYVKTNRNCKKRVFGTTEKFQKIGKKERCMNAQKIHQYYCECNNIKNNNFYQFILIPSVLNSHLWSYTLNSDTALALVVIYRFPKRNRKKFIISAVHNSIERMRRYINVKSQSLERYTSKIMICGNVFLYFNCCS